MIIIYLLSALTFFAERMIELQGKGRAIEGGEAWVLPSNVRCQVGIFKRLRLCSTLPCAVVHSPDSQTTTTLLHDHSSSQELDLDSDLSPLHLEYLFPHPRRRPRDTARIGGADLLGSRLGRGGCILAQGCGAYCYDFAALLS
jgi:hypothetical protein